jgi:hypothetical protein
VPLSSFVTLPFPFQKRAWHVNQVAIFMKFDVTYSQKPQKSTKNIKPQDDQSIHQQTFQTPPQCQSQPWLTFENTPLDFSAGAGEAGGTNKSNRNLGRTGGRVSVPPRPSPPLHLYPTSGSMFTQVCTHAHMRTCVYFDSKTRPRL